MSKRNNTSLAEYISLTQIGGLGKKRFPRRNFITTNGKVCGAVFDRRFEKALQILSGDIPDNGVLPFVCRLDKDEEVHDKRMWHKANPSLRYFPYLQAETVTLAREDMDRSANVTASRASQKERKKGRK